MFTITFSDDVSALQVKCDSGMVVFSQWPPHADSRLPSRLDSVCVSRMSKVNNTYSDLHSPERLRHAHTTGLDCEFVIQGLNDPLLDAHILHLHLEDSDLHAIQDRDL